MQRKMFVAALTVLTALAPAAPSRAGTAAPGGRILFVDGFGGSGIYAISPDGTSRVLLVAGEDLSRPRWIPDGSGASFAVRRNRWSYRLDRVDDNGGNRTTVVGPGDLPDGWAIGGYAWSPDASQLVVHLTETECCRDRLYVADADGSLLRRIAREVAEPDWSSTGRIAGVSGGQIVTMDTFGDDVEVVGGIGDSRRARWSPDGSRLLFEHRGPLDEWFDVWVVDADGSGLANLTRSPDVYDWSPSWSPTGRHIVWAASPPGEPYGFADLWRMRAGGGGKTPVTVTKRIDEYDPDWADLPV